MMTRAVAPQALGYIGIRAKALDDWASYGAGLLGLQRVDQSRSSLAFRMDDRKQRIVVHADTSDFITSFYTWTPSAFMVEYGWGARTIDVEHWQAYERKEGPSLWGHDRRWLSAADNAKARALRVANAADGYRRPVQVIEGNYQVMPGVCPWWDSLTSRGGAKK